MLGVHSLSEPEETKQIFDILEVHNHPNFDTRNYDNDIALIKVSVFSRLGKTPTSLRNLQTIICVIIAVGSSV